MLWCVAVCCSVLQCVAVCCNVLQRVKHLPQPTFANALQGLVVCRRVLQCVAKCCRELQYVVVCQESVAITKYANVLQGEGVAVCCSVV